MDISNAQDLIKSPIPVPDWWKSREDQIQDFVDNKIVKGKVDVLAISPGGRKVRAVSYGEPEPELRGTANFNSALGARNPGAYYRRGSGIRKRPVLVILAGVHGQEMEGMVGAVSILNLLETGKDILGREHPSFLAKLQKLRMIVIPIANPDGRRRVPYDGWCGMSWKEMEKWGTGTKKNGETYWWPNCKAVHPMKGDVGILGGYFDDSGVNIQHDEWSSPMSPATRAILELARNEGPDLLLNLHSDGSGPELLPLNYVPYYAKLKLEEIAHSYCWNLKKMEYPFLTYQFFKDDDPSKCPPPFNLDSMLFHTGVDLCITHESPQGFLDEDYKYGYTYEDLLNIHHILFETAADCLLK